MWLELLCALLTMNYQILNNGIANFNIMNDAKVTTFDNDGFYTTFKVDSQQETVLQNGELTLNGCFLKTKLEYWQEKEYVRISYTVKNFVNIDKKISISTYSDIQIDTNDKAPVSNMAKNRGFRMSDGKLTIEVYARNAYGVTDVDAYWYGNTKTMYNNIWSSGTESSPTYFDLKNVDSAMSLSWKNRVIKPGETQEFSFLLGFGEYYNKPELVVNTVPEKSYYGSESIKLAGYMTHTDTPRYGRLIVELDHSNDKIVFQNADIGRKNYNWQTSYQLPANLRSGTHTISVFGFDDKNMATEVYNYEFTYTPSPTPAPLRTPHITPFHTAHVTAHETPHITPFNTAHVTAHETPHITPFNTAFYTEHETPFETPLMTPFETFLETPIETAHETPFNTEFQTESETPFDTAYETVQETPAITPHETDLVPLIPESNSDVNGTNEHQDMNGNGFRIITANKWVIIVVVALIIMLVLIAVLGFIIYMIAGTYKEITSESDDIIAQEMDINELTADDSGETVDISDCDVEQAEFFITTFQE